MSPVASDLREPRLEEERLVQRCVLAARGLLASPADAREANVLRLASMVLPAAMEEEARRLAQLADDYLRALPGEARLTPDAMVRRGWVVDLPRFSRAVRAALEG